MQLGRRARSASRDRWATAEKFASWNRLIEDFIVVLRVALLTRRVMTLGTSLLTRRVMIGVFNAGRKRLLEDSIVKGRG